VSFLPLENASVNHVITIMEPKPMRWDRVMALGKRTPLTYLEQPNAGAIALTL
jgi:hypothetical protein